MPDFPRLSPIFTGMQARLSPKSRYKLLKILPYGIIWLLMGWYNLAIESLVPGYTPGLTNADIAMTPGLFIFASFALLDAGWFMGILEVFWIGKRFQSVSLGRKIFYKMGIYLAFMVIIVGWAYPIAASLESGVSPFSQAVRDRFKEFLVSAQALSTLISLTASIFVSLLYAGISEHLGHGVLLNFLTGKYHRPKVEERIFMFLDLSGSTTLAEQLGHQKYFKFLGTFYNNLSDAIISYRGEVYQYVGDEIVISWPKKTGLQNANCLRCFFAMKKAVDQREKIYLKEYGLSPSFKAAMHMGPVTTGEIGALKKEIFFTGDVLNVTARLQSLCKKYGERLLVSGILATRLHSVLQDKGETSFQCKNLGREALKGRSEPVEVVGIHLIGSGE